MYERDWATLPPRGSVGIRSGFRKITSVKCRDLPHNLCPRRRGPDHWHATHEVGRALILDDLIGRNAAGDVTPLHYQRISDQRKVDVILVTADDRGTYFEITGALGEPADLPPAQLATLTEVIRCKANAGQRLAQPTAGLCDFHTHYPKMRVRSFYDPARCRHADCACPRCLDDLESNEP
jgi:hypothetical protein